MATTLNQAARSGTHPREARIQESSGSSADLPGPNLNEEIEDDPFAKDTNAKDTDELDLDVDPEERQRSQEEIGGTEARAKVISDRVARHTFRVIHPASISRE